MPASSRVPSWFCSPLLTAAAIQTIKRLADHLSHSIDWIECETYSRSDLFLFQAAITATSRALHSSLDREVYLDRVTIEVPHTWTEMDCRTPLSMACLTPTSRKVILFLLLHHGDYSLG